MNSFRGSAAAAVHEAGVLLLRVLLCPLLPDGASDHAVATLDVRCHDPLDSPKHLAHSFIQGKHTGVLLLGLSAQKMH